ncbi:neutral zinc metallopeptidase [Amycolatopsis aidingensis]|uniref:neutral zinc metallopeptidase n=1 Tax=Amycolatopsis aidingensis TaxID=2842453 RepID=UPI001C0DD7BB|nr:neutral zinc metallopeptidase [Amycolatopsis aidingensis]
MDRADDPFRANRPEEPVVAEVPPSSWRPEQPPDPWQGAILPPPPPRHPAPQPPPRNSPAAILGTLVIVLGLVLVVALAGRTPDPVEGTAVAMPGLSEKLAAEPSEDQGPQPVRQLGTNPLLDDGVVLPAVTCELPRIGRSTEQLLAFYQAGMRCLDEAWEPVLREVNEPFFEAGLEVTADAATRCGDAPPEAEATAYYCPLDEIIYMPENRLLDTVGVDRASHLAVLAHEYGHHVQSLSGIMYAVADVSFAMPEGSPEELEMSRRVELQANCFAGLFIAAASGRGSVTGSLSEAAMADFRNTIGGETHGSVENQVAWAWAGFEGEGTAACNTWTADAEEVR